MVKAPPAPLERLNSPHIAIRRQFQSPRKLQVDRPPAYYHSGDLGDIIYSLLWVKHRGGGAFYLGPDTKWETNSKQNHVNYHWILPLLRVQPYIKKAEYSEAKPECITHDLNIFRELWMDANTRHTQKLTRLFEAYPRRFADHVKLPEDEPWLSVDAYDLHEYPVVIHRSPRYRNPDFPWYEAARRYGNKLLFVGLKHEYEEWIKTFGNVADFRQVQDALEMARIIARAKLFIGNQSFPMAVALGLNKPIIQETGTFEPDCIFNRPNAQYFCKGEIQWPKFGRRYVIPIPDPNGWYDLGPRENAHNMGDTLSLTPLIRELKGKAILNLPPSMEKIAPLFTDLCPVRFTEDYPVFRHYSDGGKWHMAEWPLRLFKKWPSDTLPVVRITDDEKVWALNLLKDHGETIAFCPTCNQEWSHIRQRPKEYWEPFIDALKLGYTVLQFGLQVFPLVGKVKDFRKFTIRQMAALYSVIGRYIGVDTGDYHLMLAVGGKTLTLIPAEQKGYRPREWCYNDPRAIYCLFDDKPKIDNAIETLLLETLTTNHENHINGRP